MSEFAELIGKELGPTEWLEVDQERIDGFAKATDDPQWIHTDPVRAAEGPFGTTIAHGFLTLSLCVPLMAEALGLTGYRIGINYGVNKVRFPAAVPSGSASERASPSSRSRRSRVATRESCSPPSSARAATSPSASPSSSPGCFDEALRGPKPTGQWRPARSSEPA